MNDRSLAGLLAELDAELAGENDPRSAADEIQTCVEARVLGVVMRSAAGTQLRSLGCMAPAPR
jgi:hypothetical protein